MRCRGARRVMMAALDGELAGSELQAYRAHLGACEACRAEAARTRRLHAALGRLPERADVPAGLEQATLRRVRAALAEAEEAPSAPWSAWARWWLPIPAAVALGLVLALRLGSRPADVERAAVSEPAAAEVAARAPAVAPAPDGAARPTGATEAGVPAELPPQVAAAPELFLDMPILEHLEKLQNFDTIRTVDVAGDDRDGRG